MPIVFRFAVIFALIAIFCANAGAGWAANAVKKPCNCKKLKTEAEALATLRQHEQSKPRNDQALFTDHLSLARVLTANRKCAEAAKYAAKALSLAHSNTQRAEAHAAIGWILSEQNKYPAAALAFEDALREREKYALHAKPSVAQLEATAMLMQQLAAQYRKENQPARARAMMNKAADTMEAAHGKDHALTKLSREMAKATPR